MLNFTSSLSRHDMILYSDYSQGIQTQSSELYDKYLRNAFSIKTNGKMVRCIKMKNIGAENWMISETNDLSSNFASIYLIPF